MTNNGGFRARLVEGADHLTLVDEITGRYAARPEAPPAWSYDQPLANVQGFAEDFGSGT